MQIKRLRLTGFKSFVDAADLRIEPGLTGVVGPNGCGKSNLLEALRWVMGETSAKSMRGAGMEDVIFAGTATRPPRDFAEVSILADEAVDVGTGEAGELEVVRRIERGAGSAYRLNGRDVRAKDVALVFADAATGAHSPALVSQGRIGAVIAAKPADRRAMLEEAAGIAGLHVRRKDAEQKLRATEANLARLDEVIADTQARAAQLKRQARAAERYRALSAAIRVAEARMIYARWREAAQGAEAAKAEAQAADAQVAAAAEAQRAAAAHAHAATEALAASRAAALAARDAAAEAGHALAALTREREAAVRRLSDLADQARRLADDRAREGELANDAAEALDRLAAEGKALDARIAEAEAGLPALAADAEIAERVARDAEVALAQGLAAAATEAAEARVATAAREAAQARADRAARDLAAVARELAAIADPAPIAAERDAARAWRAAGEQAATDARQALEAATAAEAAARADRDAAQAARSAAHAELATIEADVRALEKATAVGGRDRLLDHVVPQPGYERALAAALGDDLEIGLAEGAVRRWAGAAVQPGDPAPPEGTAPLSDHVAAPPALARRLAQVVVGEDAGQALAVGQRLVTRDGRLRRWDGMIAESGGEAAAERLERINRLKALEAARGPAAVAAAEADAGLAAVDARIQAARDGAAAARRAVEAAEVAVREAARIEDRALSALERLAGQRDDLQARHDRLAGEAAEAGAELARARDAVATLPDGAATRQAVAELQAAADGARARVATVRADRASAERAIADARTRAAQVAAEAKGWRARAGEAARRIADMARREAALAAEVEALADRPDSLAAAIAEAAAGHEGLRIAAEAAAADERVADTRLREAEGVARVVAEQLAECRELRAGAAARAEAQDLRRVEMGRVSGERFECPAPLLPERAGFDAGTVRMPSDESAAHEKLTLERERLGPVNLVAETELAELEGAAAQNLIEREELGLAVNRLRGSIGTLNREGRERLRAAFVAVNGHFRRLFTTLFNGGQAHLALVDSDDPLEAGLEIMAQPPGKRLQSLTLLSGGEQALTAVALIFALFLTNPAPICVLDEVDAPLDDANIERFCDLLDAMTRETDTRYLIVTHNAATMARMHRLFGVTMVEQGVSRLVSVDLGGAERLLAAE